MRIVGWLASTVGLAGIFACNALTPLLWVLKSNLRQRSRDLLAIPAAGLDGALVVTDRVSDWLADASVGIAEIKAQADLLAIAPPLRPDGAPGLDPADAIPLATAIDEFIAGPYARLQTVYVGLRELALSVGETLKGIGQAVPMLAIASSLGERLEALDVRIQELDAQMTALGQLGPAGLAEPGVALRVSARAVEAGERVATIGELIAEFEGWLHESQQRVAAADRRTGRLLTIGAAAGTLLALFVAGLNFLLFQQGRHWSRR
jgi:hypothetical protein